MILSCLQCSKRFRGKPHRKYCGFACHHAARRVLSDDLVRQLAFTGEGQRDVGARLGVSTNLIARHLHRLGVMDQWREQRWI